MAVNIPSRNVPMTDAQGRISPIWHEFLRSFVAASVEGTVAETVNTTTITAGNGLTGGGVGDVTLTVGQGQGIAVNADDVSVDINSQTAIQAVLDDEILVSDISDNNAIRKAKVRDIVALSSPGGINTNIQYNDDGIFEGDSGFSTDGAGSIDITGDLDVDNININGNTISITDTNGDLVITPNGTGGIEFSKYIRNAAGSDTTRSISFAGNSIKLQGVNADSSVSMGGSSGWTINTFSGRSVDFFSNGVANTGMPVRLDASSFMCLATTAGITASTTQTQGQQPLSSNVSEISVCANANDTVTLPVAEAGYVSLVINNGAQTLKVFPSSGCDLGAGVNTSTTIVAGSRKLFIAYDTVNWEPVI